ncbi:MAG: AsnC family protein [Sphingomonas adhaesiva]|uniref:AsnC family protein n=1 Tax=Sphingomonas adhaesiva TaxID=28212 RepID=UPI002FFC13AB
MTVSAPPPPPLRAMTRLLAEMQTTILSTALPLFDGRVDRFMIFTLLVRRMIDGGRPTPVLAVAESLGLPFETTRRHVAELTAAGWVGRERGGIVVHVGVEDGPVARLATVTHDAMVRFIEDMGAIDALPDYPPAARPYHWYAGLAAAADLMLSVASTNTETHQDRMDLVLFSTVLCASSRALTLDPVLARAYATLDVVPPEGTKRPVRTRRLAALLGLSEATVRRRIDRLIEGPLVMLDGGLVTREAWLSSPMAREASAASYANLRRLMGALAAQGFPFDAPASAYRAGRPAPAAFD